MVTVNDQNKKAMPCHGVSSHCTCNELCTLYIKRSR